MGFFDFSCPFRVPRGLTAKEHAKNLLDSANWHAEEINKSATVFDFVYSYNGLITVINELIWLNEKKKVFMHPSPKSELEKINSNMSSTIGSFIRRAISAYKENSDDINEFLSEMERNETISSLLTSENKETIKKLKEHARASRIQSTLDRIGREKFVDCSGIDALDVIRVLEKRVHGIYLYACIKAINYNDAQRIFLEFKEFCGSSTFPLAAEIRLESLLAEYEAKFSNSQILKVDTMDGHTFELWCASVLEQSGFNDVTVTPASNDQGVDILAMKDDIKYAIQCKCYSSDLGNKPIQEVHAGKSVYRCQVGVVMTNRYFTDGAKKVADATGILLWDRSKLIEMIEALENK